MPAEKSGKISLLDKIVRINGESTEAWGIIDFVNYVASMKNLPCVTIRFESKWS